MHNQTALNFLDLAKFIEREVERSGASVHVDALWKIRRTRLEGHHENARRHSPGEWYLFTSFTRIRILSLTLLISC